MVALRKLLAEAGLTIGQVDLMELHELFPGQALCWAREARVDVDRINTCGGSTCLGNPLGCSGVRIVVTLAHAMQQCGARYGIAAVESLDATGVALLLQRTE